MCCYHPIEVVDKHTKITRLVPCGKCIGCLKDYQNSWKIRLNDTIKQYNYVAVFFTLTYDRTKVVDTGYDDEFCKHTPFGKLHDQDRVLTVWKDDVLKWLRRCRRRMNYYYGCQKDYKYFLTAEYGPSTLRPHYHGIITISKEDFERFFLPDWKNKSIRKRYIYPKNLRRKMGKYYYKNVPNKHFKGNVDYEVVVFDEEKSPGACANYISKYCSKGMFENPRVKRGDVDKCFHLMSKGIGLSLMDELEERILQGYKDCSMTVTDDEFANVREYYGFESDTKDIAKDYYYGLLENFSSQYHEKEPFYFESGVKHEYNSDGVITKTWYDTIFCLMPRLEFLQELIARMNVVYLDDKTQNVYTYKLPRYYYDKLFPKDSAIRKGLQIALQKRNDEVRAAKLEKLRAEFPFKSDSQINHLLNLQEASELARKESEAIRRAERFYNKSKL